MLKKLKVTVKVKFETTVEVEVEENTTYMEAQAMAAEKYSQEREERHFYFGEVEEKIDYSIPMKAWREAISSK